MVKMTKSLLGPAIAAAAALTIDLHRTENPRFSQMPYREHKPLFLGRGHGKRNPNAAKQAAAKRARKITRRSRP